MLVTFHTSAHGNVVMRAEDARRLLVLMGHSGDVPSAIDADGVAAAHDRLKKAVEVRAAEEAEPADSSENDDEEPAIGLRRRAWPLLELLRAAADAETHVRWQ